MPAVRTDYPRNAGGLLALAIDLFKDEYGEPMPSLTKGTYSKQLKTMLEEGVSWRTLAIAVRMTVEQGRGASALGSVIVPAAKEARDLQGIPGDAIREARKLWREKGPPTGCRFRRGTHSGSYVEDALGYDVPPRSHHIKRPTLADVARAIHERGA